MGVAIVANAVAMSPALAQTLSRVAGPVALRIGLIAFGIGLDVLALAIGIGISGVPWNVRFRVGAAFAAAEIGMQLLGIAIGTGAGHIVGDVAAYLGFGLLAFIGVYMLKESFGEHGPMSLKATSGWGLVAASASISLDSLGVGFSLPSLGVPLIPLFVTVACSTVAFTLTGLAFGNALGNRYRLGAERGCGLILIVLAILFTLQHVRS
jgi:putative Mn2+ efflux pump MntP